MRRVAGAFIIVVLVLSGRAIDSLRSPNVPVSRQPSVHSFTGSGRPGVPRSFRNNPLEFLSTAPPDSLILLPGIGPVLAERVARARNGKSLFTQWDDLLGVKGIGPRTVERLKALAEE